MAKAPRRRSGGKGGDRGKKPVRPVRPPAAKPVKPPAARPVQPPAAKPVKPPAAAPVAKPVAPVKPPAAAPAGAGPRRAGRRAPEEEVGRARGGRAARSAGRSGGMGIGAKVGLLAALVTFLVIGLTVLASNAGADADAEEQALENFGYAAVSAFTAPDARWWRGTGGATKGLGYIEQKVKALLGKKGAEFWEARIQELTQPIPREDEGTFRGEELKEDKERFEREVKKLKGSDGPTGSKYVYARLTQVWSAATASASESDRFQLHRAWVRDAGEGNGGAWLAGTNVSQSSIKYDASGWNERGAGFAWIDAEVDGAKVRVFRGPIRASKPDERMVAFVSVFENKGKGGSGAPIGMAMLLLGPLLVGFAAYGVANGHTKSIRGLAREIDRLGSHGDPERSLRTHGAEAAAIARSVERMVSNLEFREKHEGKDLDEVVSKEQKVAEEIHGALINKNPPRLQNYEVETLFKPGFEIGGDHFEYFRVDDDHLGIMLLDTNVRGIPAALVMSATRSYVRAEAPGVLSPAEVLKRVNRHLAGELPAGRHVTALYVVLNQSDGSATIASAGHLPLLVYRHQAGKMAKVNPEGIAMGLDAGPVFDSSLQEGDIPMGLGDRIVLYTDGALRIQDAEGEEFGEQRFYAAVTAEAPKNSQAFVNFVGAAIDRFHLEVPQNDDITISTVKRLR